MTYFKIDDGFYDHPKVMSLPRGPIRKGAVSLWSLAGSWCCRYLTDGLLPETRVVELGGAMKEADALVAARLWHPGGDDCWIEDEELRCPPVPGGHFLYHQWPEHQDLKSLVEERRMKARVRMANLRSSDARAPTVRANSSRLVRAN
jgi:hypothetical protein